MTKGDKRVPHVDFRHTYFYWPECVTEADLFFGALANICEIVFAILIFSNCICQ
jgi:hypothetical protein